MLNVSRLTSASTLLVLAAACSAGDSQAPATEPAAVPVPTAPVPAAPADTLTNTDLAPGEGEPIALGQVAVVHYTGWLYEAGAPDNKGRKFDSSLDRNEPFKFKVGAGEVISGWDQGVAGMRKGGKRRLIIPASLGYGDAGAGGVIPGGATLVFDVELLGIEAPAQ
jgi:FKBP-type peptidyl-prolyl cis-trans isomerase FkpA